MRLIREGVIGIDQQQGMLEVCNEPNITQFQVEKNKDVNNKIPSYTT